MKPQTPEDEGPLEATPPQILFRVMLGLAIWGLLLAIGAALFGVDENGSMTIVFRPLRGLIVVACVGGFLGFWGLLLRIAPKGDS